ncbi:MAG: hypothetical protein AAGG51_08025 [Cyanobacteria bacterium P01_G01_bin.54]
MKRHEWLIIFGAAIAALIPFFSRDKPDVSGGFAGDAGIYGDLAQDFYGRWAEGVNSFYLGRSLPSWLLHHVLHLFTPEPSYHQVLMAFGLLNVVAIALMGYVWCLVCRRLQITAAGAGLGFIGLFLNHHILKTSGQSPIRTEFCAYALSLLLFWVYLQRPGWGRRLGMLAVTIALTFTWPAGIYMCTLLWLFPGWPNHPEPSPESDPETSDLAHHSVSPPPYKLHYILALLPTIAGFIYMQALLPGDLDYLGRGVPLERVGYLSIAIATSYLFVGLSELLRNARFYRWASGLSYLKSWQFWVKLLGLAVLFKLPGMLATDGGYPMVVGHVIYLVVLTSILQPGVFFIAHLVYYGPLLIFGLFFWRPVCQLLHRYGLGLSLWAALMFVFSLGSESRHIVNFYPVLVTLIVLATRSLRQAWKPWHYWVFGGLSLFTSKVWLTIGTRPGDVVSEPQAFPAQFYFMNHGPWMSNLMYAIQAAISVVLIYAVYDLWIRGLRPGRAAIAANPNPPTPTHRDESAGY